MLIRYLAHSGFMLEGSYCNLLFDFVNGNLPVESTSKPLYVFVSHRHADHFSKRIFSLGAERIFLDLKENEYHSYPFFSFCTYPSTDEGVCFAVRFEDKLIYYAGDNGDWYWDEEEKWRDLKHVSILREIGHVDIAIAPADPRLPDPCRTFSEIIDIMDPDLIIPMHMWGKEADVVPLLKEKFGQKVDFGNEIQL